MSRDPADPGPPRRTKPVAKRPVPEAPPTEEDEHAPTTFVPTSKKNKNPAQARSSTLPADDRRPLPAGPKWWERFLFGSVGSGQLARFCRQFAAYLDAGVDILKALTSLEGQFARTALGPVIGRIRVGVRQGESLAVTVMREPQAFDSLFVSMIKVAEARGGVPEALHRLSRHYEARQSLIRQARSAMIYPLSVLVVAGAAVALITLWLLPKFIAMLKEVAGRTPLPLPSRMLMAFSDFVGSSGWWLIPLVLFGVPFVAVRLYKTPGGKKVMDEVALYIPVLGQLLRKIDTTRFARTLSVLLGSGVDVGTSLDLTAGVMQLEPFRRAIQNARRQVLDGSDLSGSLAESGRFGPDVIAVLGSGEETGRIPESLERLADDYEEQVTYMVKNMGQLVQPVLLVILGGVVLFIILAVLLPYIAVITNMAGGAGS